MTQRLVIGLVADQKVAIEVNVAVCTISHVHKTKNGALFVRTSQPARRVSKEPEKPHQAIPKGLTACATITRTDLCLDRNAASSLLRRKAVWMALPA